MSLVTEDRKSKVRYTYLSTLSLLPPPSLDPGRSSARESLLRVIVNGVDFLLRGTVSAAAHTATAPGTRWMAERGTEREARRFFPSHRRR